MNDHTLQQGLMTFLSSFLPLMAAMVFHEYAHGWMAKRWGDGTAEEAGRLTLNPVPHVDPVGTILLPMGMMLLGTGFLFGWAKPVPIDPRRFRHFRKGLFWVSAAGPLMNFIFALVSALVLGALLRFTSPEGFLFHRPLTRMAEFSILINFVLGLFNLFPLPPLDGSKMIQSFLSPAAQIRYESIARYSFFILMALLFTGAMRFLLYPVHILTHLALSLSAWVYGFSGPMEMLQ